MKFLLTCKKRIGLVLVLALVTTVLAGCGREKSATADDSFKLFYVNNSETGIVAVSLIIGKFVNNNSFLVFFAVLILPRRGFMLPY